MTANERLEALLNRAGQTISDLPKSYPGGPEAYGDEARLQAQGAAWMWYLPEVLSPHDALTLMINMRDVVVLRQYILHLSDVIDRMETALENVIGERAYLARRLCDADCDCDICVYSDVNEAEMPCYQCDIPGRHFEFAGIPEDWRADDE